LIGGLVEDHGEFILAGNHVQTVSAGGKFLSVNQYVIGYGELRRLVSTGAPHVTVGRQRIVFARTGCAIDGAFARSAGTGMVRFDELTNFFGRDVPPDGASFRGRAMIGNRDVRDADSLRHRR
jgi:hypothetical protein